MPAPAVRLLGCTPALVLAAILGRLNASVPAVVTDLRLHARSRLALHRSATAALESPATATAGGDTVMVQPTPLERIPAMPMAARTMALIPIATATTPTVAIDAFSFATSQNEFGQGGPYPTNTAVDIVSALAPLVLETKTCSLPQLHDVEVDLASHQRVELVGQSTTASGERHSISCSTS